MILPELLAALRLLGARLERTGETPKVKVISVGPLTEQIREACRYYRVALWFMAGYSAEVERAEQMSFEDGL